MRFLAAAQLSVQHGGFWRAATATAAVTTVYLVLALSSMGWRDATLCREAAALAKTLQKSAKTVRAWSEVGMTRISSVSHTRRTMSLMSVV